MRIRSWQYWWPALVFLTLVIGQVYRVQLVPGASGALSMLDAALALSVFGLLVRLIAKRRVRAFVRNTWRHPVWKWSVLFFAWAAFSLAFNAFHYSGKELLVASGYLGRLGLALGLLWFANDDPPPRGYVLGTFSAAAGALVLLGFLQLIFVPDFTFMIKYGWDPHIGRMLSTFYDPNYFGVFLVLVMAVALARVFETAGPVRRAYITLFAMTWIGLYLTYSRSAWIAGLLAVPTLAWRKERRLALLIAAVFIGALFVPTRLSQRFQASESLIKKQGYSAKGYQCTPEQLKAKLCDKSGSSRIYSLRQGLALVESDPVIGVGYNAYGYALVDQKIVRQSRLRIHSSQGSDSSLLNVAATTGIIGLGLFLTFIVRTMQALWRAARVRRASWLPHALFWFTFAWLAASFFNNALFYLPILVPWVVLVGAVGLTGRKAA